MVDIWYSAEQELSQRVWVSSWTQVYSEHRKLSYENIESILLNTHNRLSPKSNRVIYSVIAEANAVLDTLDTLKQYMIDVYTPQQWEQSILPLFQESEPIQTSPQENLKSRFQKLWQKAVERREQAEKVHTANANNPKPEFEPIGKLIQKGWSIFKEVVKRDLFLKKSN